MTSKACFLAEKAQCAGPLQEAVPTGGQAKDPAATSRKAGVLRAVGASFAIALLALALTLLALPSTNAIAYADDNLAAGSAEVLGDLGQAGAAKGVAAKPAAKRTSIANAKVVVSKTSFTYTGKVQKPTVKTVGGKALKVGSDYTLKYSSASSKAVGSYAVWVVGKGNYTGTSAKTTYKIKPASLVKASVSGVVAKTYTGKAITQRPVVKVGDRTLKAGTDYTVTYKNNVKPGTASMAIKGKGNYTGTRALAFKVKPAGYYVTKSGKKYHVDGCRYLGKSKVKISLAEAKQKGYAPCSVCKP